MESNGKDIVERKSGHPGVGNVLQGGDPGGDTVWIEVIDPIGINVEDSGRDAHRVPAADHGEVGAEKPIWDFGYTDRRWSVGGSGDAVGVHIHRPHTKDGIPEGGEASYP